MNFVQKVEQIFHFLNSWTMRNAENTPIQVSATITTRVTNISLSFKGTSAPQRNRTADSLKTVWPQWGYDTFGLSTTSCPILRNLHTNPEVQTALREISRPPVQGKVHLCSSAAPEETRPNFRAPNLLPRSCYSFKVQDAAPIFNVHRITPGKFSPPNC